MAKSQSIIAPFPEHIDRRDFGNWLSGFADGEGCFLLGTHQRKRTGRSSEVACTKLGARFSIRLRADDVDALKLIQSYFGCGVITCHDRSTAGHPQCTFTMHTYRDLAQLVISHFVSHPLFAKKRHDFTVWKEGVELAFAVSKRQKTNAEWLQGHTSCLDRR